MNGLTCTAMCDARPRCWPVQGCSGTGFPVVAASTGGLRGSACGAGSETREDLVDHRRPSSEREDAHHAMAGGTRERVDLEDLLQERRPAAGGLDRRDAWRGDDHGRRRYSQ